MSHKIYINRIRHLKSLELEGTVVESILEGCIKEASIVEITFITQGVLQRSLNTIKKYLFYLIECDLITYSGQKQVFVITKYGWDLLARIKMEKISIGSENIDIMLSLE